MDKKKRRELIPERDATKDELQWIKCYITLSYHIDSKADHQEVRRPRKPRKSRPG